nr:hypothetical protein BaRGS_023421 [Batillaria attramentaria]
MFKAQWSVIRDAFSSLDGESFSLAYAGDTLAVSTIVVGCFIFFVSLLGLLGALCEIRIVLSMYALVVVTLIMIETIVLIVIVTKAERADGSLEESLAASFSNYHEDNSDVRSRAIATLFGTLLCCGVNGSDDFRDGEGVGSIVWTPHYDMRTSVDRKGVATQHGRKSHSSKPVYRPITCCPDVDYEHLSDEIFQSKKDCLFQEDYNATFPGCLPKIKSLLHEYKDAAIGTTVVILLLEIAVVVFACHLCCRDDTEQFYKRAQI